MKLSFRAYCLAFLFTGSLAWSQQNPSAATSGQIQTATNAAAPGSTELGSTAGIKSIPELYPGESSDFGTQRIVQEKKFRKWVELNLSWQSSYTDNYLLANIPSSSVSGGKLQTTQMTSTWDLAFAPDPFQYEGVNLFPRVGFRQTFWNYGIGTGQNSNFAAFDFDTQTVYGDTRADFGDGWSATVGADWTRITSSYADDEIYRQIGPRWSVSKQFKLNDYNVLTVSLDQQYLFTEAPTATPPTTNGIPYTPIADDLYDHLSTTFGLSYVWSPVDRLFVTPFYRMNYSYYPHYDVYAQGATFDGTSGSVVVTHLGEDRSDFVNTVGLSTTYQFNDYISARVFVSYEKRTTTYSDAAFDPNNTNVPEYSKFDAGMGGGLTIRF